MRVLEPERIEELLNRRLQKTIDLYLNLDTDDVEIYNIIYFRLYFDFSTAIEKTVNSILVSKYDSDKFVMQKAKIDNKGVSNYLGKEDMKNLIGDFGSSIKVKDIKDRFISLMDGGLIKESFFMSLNLEKSVFEIEPFLSIYSDARNTRNQLAHGLAMENVAYTNRMTFNFMVSYYVLIQFYKGIIE